MIWQWSRILQLSIKIYIEDESVRYEQTNTYTTRRTLRLKDSNEDRFNYSAVDAAKPLLTDAELCNDFRAEALLPFHIHI